MFIAATLHDLGLCEAHRNDPGSFEWVGARLAHDFCKDEGLAEERAELMHNASALHSSLGIADRLKLPAALAAKPHLQEFYGSVAYAARAYFAGTLGWFDGNPTSLVKLPPAAEAAHIIDLAGGPEAVRAAAESALANRDWQWAMQLADMLLARGEETDAARAVKVTSMRQLADQTINAPTRNYYLLSARELEDQ